MSKLFSHVLIVVGIAACGQRSIEPPTPSVERIRAHLAYLADDAREGRGVGTAGLDTAAAYIARTFEAIGLEPGVRDSYLQPFVIDPTAPAAAHQGLGGERVANVVGMLPGRGDLAGQVVVLGAHYDHLGYGGPGSLDPAGTATVHNGADDNASGTAVVLEAARLLANDGHAGPRRAIVFVAFTAEELGLIGSSHFVQHSPFTADSTFAMINLDMVGHLESGQIAAFGSETADELPAILDSVNTVHALDLTRGGDGFGSSDHQSFFLADIPVLHFFTGTHADYHRSSDDVATIDFDGTVRVAAFTTDLIRTLATRRAALTFRDAEPRQLVASSGPRPWLGTIPDMTTSPGGVLLNGVTPGSPADEAGLLEGDILIAMGTHAIADLFDMTNALNAHRPGEQVSLDVRRGTDTLHLLATLRRRP